MSTLLLTCGIFGSVVLLCAGVIFILSRLLRDNSIMDIAYGPIFAIATWGTIYLTDRFSSFTLILALMVTLWAARLSLRILRKNWGKPEDARYAAWREQWCERGELYFILRSFLQINLLQGLIITIVSLPIIVGIDSAFAPDTPWLVAGLSVFLLGLLIETTADLQLDRFIARKKAGTEPAQLMTTGLFRYSRRPNYFGESLIWWGLCLTTVSLPGGLVGIAGPLLITYIVTRVTGPMLEEIFLAKYPQEYRAYMERTNYFIPWFPKSNNTSPEPLS